MKYVCIVENSRCLSATVVIV